MYRKLLHLLIVFCFFALISVVSVAQGNSEISSSTFNKKDLQYKINLILQVEKSAYYRNTLNWLKNNINTDINKGSAIKNICLDGKLFTLVYLNGAVNIGSVYIVSRKRILYYSNQVGTLSKIQTKPDNYFLKEHQLLLVGSTGGTGVQNKLTFLLEYKNNLFREIAVYPTQGYVTDPFLPSVAELSCEVFPISHTVNFLKFRQIVLLTIDSKDPKVINSYAKQLGYSHKPFKKTFYVTLKWDKKRHRYLYIKENKNSSNPAFSSFEYYWEMNNR